MQACCMPRSSHPERAVPCPPPPPPVVDDLLYAFLGLSGTYVRARPVNAPGGARLGYEIAARGQLEPALQEMAARMVPIWWVPVTPSQHGLACPPCECLDCAAQCGAEPPCLLLQPA